jgi:hypothetical protein
MVVPQLVLVFDPLFVSIDSFDFLRGAKEVVQKANAAAYK